MRVTSLLWILLCSAVPVLALEPCRIEIVEKGTGWPVPLVELKTTHHLRFFSDNNGLIACDAPELMGQETWFDVIGHGYERPKDGFGYAGVRLVPEPGKTLRVEVERKSIAKRLGRLTGAGIFAESQKLGLERDWEESGVFGCDSVLTAEYRGGLIWAWGDTVMPQYPFGIFHASGAMTSLRPLKSFQPPLKLQFDYFKDERGKLRGVAPMPGSGPTWLTGFGTLPDKNGKERLVAGYTKIKPPIEGYEKGLCVWNDEEKKFERLAVIWSKSEDTNSTTLFPDGHPVLWKDAQGKQWVLYCNPFPVMRCPATFEAWQDRKTWERLEPQKELKSPEGRIVKTHSGHIAWSEFRKRWVAVFEEIFGNPSAFGEIWYAEADSPMGPWGTAVKILSHQNYTFYNPRLHLEFTDAQSSVLLFEGTYTSDFADKPQVAARHNYNQVLYRLDLDDPALGPAHAKPSP